MEQDQAPSAADRGSELSEGLGAWQPIETAPAETEVLVWFGPYAGVKSAAYTSPWGDDTKLWCVDDAKFDPHPVRGYSKPYPTHWMPLPAPPESA